MRGERLGGFQTGQHSSGSSPHARGTHPRMPRRPTRSPVHPRMRGERNVRNLVGRHVHGSSPHARGTLTSVPANGRNTRFIPACAGNAQSRTGGERESSVHPRMRGERQWMHAAALALDGSSPHARGTPSRRLPGVLLGRFIPACAGNADAGTRVGTGATVHPRMRGERTSNKLLIYRRKSEPSDSTKHSGC